MRKRPYSVVLLDEVEKAHRDVINLFYQVFDRGFMRDGEGREIDFRNTVILMTSNLGGDAVMQMLEEQPETTESDLHELLRPSCAIISSRRYWLASRLLSTIRSVNLRYVRLYK